MKKKGLCTLLVLFSSLTFADTSANDTKSIVLPISDDELKLIYGKDDRFEADDFGDQKFIDLSRSVAGRVPRYRLGQSVNNPDNYRFSKITLKQNIPNICETERFQDQVTLADCTGFLVGPRTLVTAGHCMQSKYECDKNVWVFGFKHDSQELEKKNVYACKKVVAQKFKYSKFDVDDYAVIELDRDVTDREPLEIRREGKIKKGTPLVVIGHPLGLPLKIADGANVSKNNLSEFFTPISTLFKKRKYFIANLDTYGGNSGSPVFNRDTGAVEGILVQGAEDFTKDAKENCVRSVQRTNSRWTTQEKVFRITKVPGI